VGPFERKRTAKASLKDRLKDETNKENVKPVTTTTTADKHVNAQD
jgi:hypothetical protein